MRTKKHCELAKQSAGQSKITAVSFRRDTLADQITAAEIFYATFTAEHNLPFLAAVWVEWAMGRGVLLNEAKSCQIALLVLQNYDHRLGSLRVSLVDLQLN